MSEKFRCLPGSELDVMLAIWGLEAPVSRGDLEPVRLQKKWSVNTLNTLLARLIEKGFLRCEQHPDMGDRRNYYTPLVGRQEYLALENRSFLGKLYNHSVTGLVAALCQQGELTDRELQELQDYLRQLEGGKPHGR